MEEDKKLRSLLSEYAVHEPSPAFDNNVMKMIESSKTDSFKSSINLFIAIPIAIVAIILLTAPFFMQPEMFRQITVPISHNTYTQLFSFFAAFWFVMILNIWWNKSTSVE